VGRRLHLGARIGRGHGEADAAHDHHVGEVVADVGDLLRSKRALPQDLLEDRTFSTWPW